VAWSHLQSASVTNSGPSTIAKAYASNVSSGTKLIAVIDVSTNDTSEAVQSIKDGSGNAMTQLISVQLSATSWVELWAMDTPAGDVGTKPTITATLNAAVSNFGCTLLIQEVSGLLAGDTSAMLDGTGSSNTSNPSTGTASPATSAAYSSTAANEYLITIYGDPGNGVTVSTPATGYTADGANVNASSSATVMVGYKNSGNAAESASFAFTPAGANFWTVLLVAFKLAGGAAGVSGTVQPRATVPVPRRPRARAVWARVTGQAFVQVPAPRQQPRPAPRRAPARAAIRFTPVTTANAAPPAPPAGSIQPRAAVPVPRRRPARAIAHGIAAPGIYGSAPAQRYRTPPRRTPARAAWRGIAGAARVAVPAPRQQYRTPPRRPRARAVIRFTPVTTANAAPSRTLLISLASSAGADDYGNSFPRGILATAGVIQGPEFLGSDFIITAAGAFFYSGTPAAGNLTASVASASGTDPYGNAYLAGIVSYVSIASGPAAGSYALQAGQVSVLGTPAPGYFVHNVAHPAAIPASIVAISGSGGCEIVLGSGASTGSSTEAAVVVQDSTLSGLAGGVVNVVAGQLQVNGTPVTVP
jgi:hypothetical protein